MLLCSISEGQEAIEMITLIKKFLHDVLGWHDGKLGPHFFDGASNHAVCSQCGKEVMQDSQGNWLPLTSGVDWSQVPA